MTSIIRRPPPAFRRGRADHARGSHVSRRGGFVRDCAAEPRAGDRAGHRAGGPPALGLPGDLLRRRAGARSPARRLARQLLTAPLNADAGLNRGALDAAISMVSPVCGLRPWRAERSLTLNFPKPLMATSSPAATRVAMTSNVASRIRLASAVLSALRSATRPASSFLLTLGMGPPPVACLRAQGRAPENAPWRTGRQDIGRAQGCGHGPPHGARPARAAAWRVRSGRA